MSKDEKNFKTIQKIYMYFNKYNLLECSFLCLILVGFVLDVFLKKDSVLDSNDIGMFAGLVLVIWTFTVSMIIFYLGQMKDENYGIRIIESMRSHISIKKIVNLTVLFIMHLLILLLSVVCKMKNTLCICSIFQIVMMSYVFMMVCIETSRTTIKELVKNFTLKCLQENGEKREIGWLMKRLLYNLNYKDEGDIDDLLKMFQEIEASDISQSAVKCLAAEFAAYIIKASYEKEISTEILQNLLVNAKREETKKWLLASVLLHMKLKNSPDILAVLECEFEGRHDLIMFCIAYAAFYSQFVNMKYLRYQVERLIQMVRMSKDKVQEEKISKYWIYLIKEHANSSNLDTQFDLLSKWLFREE